MKTINARIPMLTLAAACAGCASVNSTMHENKAADAGASKSDGALVYYMPERDIVFTVTNAGGKITSITAAASPPYADRSKTYTLEYSRHPLAKNTLDIDVSEAGLLTNSKSNQTGDAVAALGGLGTLAGYLRGSNAGIQSAGNKDIQAKDAGDSCSLDGNHTFIKPVNTKDTTLCNGITFTIEKLGGTSVNNAPPVMGQVAGQSYAGVFYRVNLAHKVTMKVGRELHAETIVFSPSGSKEYFLPIARTFFANNDAKITLSHGAGVPSKVVQDTEGEVAALLKLPAAIVTPYFAAIGQMFAGFSSKSTSETTALNSSLSLELTKMKYAACIKAIEDKDTELIASLRCSGS